MRWPRKRAMTSPGRPLLSVQPLSRCEVRVLAPCVLTEPRDVALWPASEVPLCPPRNLVSPRPRPSRRSCLPPSLSCNRRLSLSRTRPAPRRALIHVAEDSWITPNRWPTSQPHAASKSPLLHVAGVTDHTHVGRIFAVYRCIQVTISYVSDISLI